MKNKDYNLGVEYEVKIMSSLELKNKLMKDNNLTEEDIFIHYSLIKKENVDVQYADLDGKFKSHDKYGIGFYGKDSLIENYFLLKKGLLPNKNIEYFVGLRTIEEICKIHNIEDKPFLDDNGTSYCRFIEKHPKIFKSYMNYLYGTTTYHEALLDTLKYNIELFNKNKNIPTEQFNQGIENSCIVINEKSDGKYELIDGFYRVLYKNIDRDVLVKVYKNLTDEEWFKLMINCNFWKTNIDESLFYDRGFLLGLRSRYGIKIEDYVFRTNEQFDYCFNLVQLLSNSIQPIFINNSIDFNRIIYELNVDKSIFNLDSGQRSVLKNDVLLNRYFISDLKMFKNYLGYLPDKLLKLKKLENINVFTCYAYQKLLNNILRLIFVYRVGTTNKEMNELPENLIDIIFEDKVIKESFIKATTMTVSGFIDNRLDLLFPNLILILDDLLSTKDEEELE